jgi:hypothetical protein
MSRTRYTLAFDHHNMVPAPGSSATVQVVWKTEEGIAKAYGDTVPTDGSSGYAPGCIFRHDDGAGGAMLYLNEGTATSSDFNLIITEDNISAQSAALLSAANANTVVDTGMPTYGTAAGRGPSPLIWSDVPVLDTILNPTLGLYYFNDFEDGPVLANNSTLYDQPVCGATGATAGSKLDIPTDEATGVLRLESTTDNEGAIIACLAGGNVGGQFLPSRTWAFEARIKQANITDSKFNTFIGFAEEALCADGSLIANTDAMADKDYFGFRRIFADGDKLDTVHNTAGGGGETELQADAVTIVADTWIKVGAKCDGTTVTFYADGVALATTVLLAATNFPDDQEMAFYFAIMLGHGDTGWAEIDWVRIHQTF